MFRNLISRNMITSVVVYRLLRKISITRKDLKLETIHTFSFGRKFIE